ncbi:hypothetical protein [Sporolactobacillus putidus]|uniref:Uncharacterized protein n=1 Tax=Sporolactobacillus putidus TaxID=492735 RepID=A0A917S308_9BACL|nr:hypothetical protein [Sporolactobacillus putidus]GGL50807.1 hypothetical protein GCM10007968_13810 [Sporolactobacillus putidus]
MDAAVKKIEKRMDKLNAAFNELSDYSQQKKKINSLAQPSIVGKFYIASAPPWVSRRRGS